MSGIDYSSSRQPVGGGQTISARAVSIPCYRAVSSRRIRGGQERERRIWLGQLSIAVTITFQLDLWHRVNAFLVSP